MKRHDSILAFFGGSEKIYNHQFFKKFSKDTPRGYGIEIAIYISDMDIETYYVDVISKVGEEYVVQSLEKKPWGTRDFRIEDPFGFYLCIRESDNILVE